MIDGVVFLPGNPSFTPAGCPGSWYTAAALARRGTGAIARPSRHRLPATAASVASLRVTRSAAWFSCHRKQGGVASLRVTLSPWGFLRHRGQTLGSDDAQLGLRRMVGPGLRRMVGPKRRWRQMGYGVWSALGYGEWSAPASSLTPRMWSVASLRVTLSPAQVHWATAFGRPRATAYGRPSAYRVLHPFGRPSR